MDARATEGADAHVTDTVRAGMGTRATEHAHFTASADAHAGIAFIPADMCSGASAHSRPRCGVSVSTPMHYVCVDVLTCVCKHALTAAVISDRILINNSRVYWYQFVS